MTIEGDSDQNHEYNDKDDEYLFFCEMFQSGHKQQQLDNKQEFEDMVEEGQLAYHIDLKDKTDQKKIKNQKFTF
jgi:hypothetical protein